MSSLIETLQRADGARRLFADGDKWISASDIRTAAARLVPRLRAVKNDTIFLHVQSASSFVAGLLAAASAGKAIALPAHTQAAYLNEIGCIDAHLITDDAFAGSDSTDALDIQNLDPLLLFFTSGSTGAPKQIEKNLSRLETEARALNSLWGADASHVAATVSHQHIYGMLFRIVWPLLTGRTADDRAATYWEDLDGRLAGVTLVSSPAHLSRLPPRADLFSPPPALIFSSGQLLTSDSAQACIAAFGKPVTEVLGSTETGGIAWRRQTVPDAAWTPLPGVSVSTDADGALSVSSPFLQTDAPLATGDTALIGGDGSFRLQPRGDRVVKVDGKRVSLTRVEEALTRLPEIETAAALTLPEHKDALGAIVVLTAEGKARLAQDGAFRLSRALRAAASSALEPPERPKRWRFVDAIPTDSQGKRVLASLRALFMENDPVAALNLDVRSQTDTEAELHFTLPPELIFFEGHFPNRPILPGVAQAHLAVLIAQKLWGDWPSDANLARLKFRRVLFPNDKVVLRLKRDAKIGRIGFTYTFGDIDASQGEIGGFKR